MERTPCGNPFFPCCSPACLSHEIQKTRLCFDVQLLRGGKLASHPWSARFLWRPGHSDHRIVPLLSRRSSAGVTLGFAVLTRTWKSCVLCAAVHPAHCDTAARDHRMGFAPTFRRCSLSRLAVVRPGFHHHLSECLPLQASAEPPQFGALCSRLSFPVHATAGPCWMGSRQHKLWGHRSGGPRLHDRIQRGPNHADNDSRVACDRAPLPGTSAHALE